MSETTELMELARYVTSGQARAIRKTAGIPAASLAADLGVTVSTLRRYETGSTRPPRRKALDWLNLLRVMDATMKKAGQ